MFTISALTLVVKELGAGWAFWVEHAGPLNSLSSSPGNLCTHAYWWFRNWAIMRHDNIVIMLLPVQGEPSASSMSTLNPDQAGAGLVSEGLVGQQQVRR